MVGRKIDLMLHHLLRIIAQPQSGIRPENSVASFWEKPDGIPWAQA